MRVLFALLLSLLSAPSWGGPCEDSLSIEKYSVDDLSDVERADPRLEAAAYFGSLYKRGDEWVLAMTDHGIRFDRRMGSVQLLSHAEAKRLELRKNEAGLFVDLKGEVLDGDYIFVMNLDHEIFVAPPNVTRFHHNSFVANQMVLSAGEMHFEKGVLTSIGNKSGHYAPAVTAFKQVYPYLEKMGVVMETVKFIPFAGSTVQLPTLRPSGSGRVR